MWWTWNRLLEIKILCLWFLSVLWFQCIFFRELQFQLSSLVLFAYYICDMLAEMINYTNTFGENNEYLDTIERSRDSNNNEIEFNFLLQCRRRILIRTITEDSILAFVCFLIMFTSMQILPISSVVCILPLVIALASKFSYQVNSYSILETVLHFALIFTSIWRLIILSFILWKLDNLINWSWKNVLWGYWLWFAIVSIICLFIFVVFLQSMHSYCNRNISCHAVIGFYYLSMLFGGFAVSSFITAINVVKMYGSNSIEDSNLNIFLWLFLPNLAYITVVILINIIFWRPLISWWNYLFYGMNEYEPEEDIEQNRVQNSNRMK